MLLKYSKISFAENNFKYPNSKSLDQKKNEKTYPSKG